MHVFSRATVRQRRERTAKNFLAYNVLFEETAAHLLERLDDVKRDFEAILSIGRADDPLNAQLAARGKKVTTGDFAEGTEALPFAANSFDLILSNMHLHWINDLPGALAQIRHALKPGGLFLAALPGGRTLQELRACLLDAELAVTGGVSPRLSPTIELVAASALLQRAGFDLPVADEAIITLIYPDMFALMRDLRGMGETNAHAGRLRRLTGRRVFDEAAKLYRERHADAEGRIPATFEIIFMHGWKPS
jgi:SAM-dependent methyltransferase